MPDSPIDPARLARTCAVALLRCEHVLGLPLSNDAPVKDRLSRIVAATRRGGLSRRLYQLCWSVPPAEVSIAAALLNIDADLRQLLSGLLQPELNAAWLPEPQNEPQCLAYWSSADLLLFGGAAGGGKSSLLVGLALTQQTRSVIFRRQANELGDLAEYLLQTAGSREGWNSTEKTLRRSNRLIELGHLGEPGSELSWQGGLGHDFIGFDEAAQLLKQRVSFVLGWLRSTDPNQRCRAILASNPPTTAEGAWLTEWFSPWLDPGHPRPAIAGELRWAVTAPDREGTTVWVEDPSPVFFESDTMHRRATPEEVAAHHERVAKPLSRTFIPSLLANNPFLASGGYRAQLQSLPEPLRTQLLTGDFLAGRGDDANQVIPTAWIEAAMARWTPARPRGAMTAMGIDVAQGGSDQTIIAVRYAGWFDRLVKKPGAECRDANGVASAIMVARRDQCPVVIDLGGGFGGDALGLLERQGIPCTGYLGNRPSNATTREGRLKFYNKRAEDWWRFREELDPDQQFGSAIALPPDPQLKAELAAPRIKDISGSRGILIEDKAEIRKRLGRSTDCADAVVMAMNEGAKAAAKKGRDDRRGQRPQRANVGHSELKERLRR